MGNLNNGFANGAGGGTVDTVVGTALQIDVNSADPANPIISLNAVITGAAALALTAVQPAGLPVGANPTASVGTAVVNGAAATFMRSDAAPPIDLGIAPVWTGSHTWSAAQPQILFTETDAAADNQRWRCRANGGVFIMEALNDAGSTTARFFGIQRSGAVITDVQFCNATDNPTATFLGTGQILKAFVSNAATPDYAFNTDADTGLRRIAANNVGLTAGGTDVFDCTNAGVMATGFVRGGTYTPSATGVANIATVTPEDAMFIRVGNIVHVAGQINVDPTASATLTRWRMSLPIASALTNARELAGCGVDDQLGSTTTTMAYQIFADATNDQAEFRCEAILGTGARNMRYTFSYRVL